MSVAWTLEYDGLRQPLAEWGIRRPPRLTFRNLDVDEMTFSIPVEDALAAPVFPDGAELVLWRGAVGWFRGKVRRSAATGSGKTEAELYTVHNVWGSLARTVYQQQRCIQGAMQYTPRVTLGQNQYAQKISAGRQISEILTYAITKGIVALPGALPEFLECWLEEVTDLTCVGAIRRALRLLPQAVGWCDYSSGGSPVINIQESTLLTAITLDALASDRIGDFSGLSPRADLVPAGVTFIYTSTERSEESEAGDGRLYTTVTRDTAGVADVEGSIVAVVELVAGETAPIGAAAAYYAALQLVPYEGTITLLEEDCSGDLRPGKVVNISNGRAAWATMRAVVQTVTEDLSTGTTVAELGVPEHLAPQDFIEQQQIARRRPKPSTFPASQSCVLPHPDLDPGDPEAGTPPAGTIANPDAGVDPDALKAERDAQNLPKTAAFVGLEGSVDLIGCVDGEDRCVRVKGVTIPCE